jgi:oligopeptidase B
MAGPLFGRTRLRTPCLTVAAAVLVSLALSGQAPPNPPIAKKVPKTTTLHGDTLTDNYSWLRQKGAPAVKAYLDAENAYTTAGTRHLATLEDTLYKEMLGRIKESDEQVPVWEDGYWYYTRTEKGKAYPIFCRRKGSPDAPEEVYLDQNALAQGKKFHALGGLDVSPDGTKVIYLEDLTAFREYTLYVKDLTTGKILESIKGVWNGTAWADDNKTFFYMTPDKAKRGDTVWRHLLGTPGTQDVQVFKEDNVLYNVDVVRSRSDKYIFIADDGFTSSEWRAIPTANPTAAPRVVAPRHANVEYSVEHGADYFYLVTNDNARNFKIVRAADRDGDLEWSDWSPPSEQAFIEGLDVFEKFAVVVERRDGLPKLRVVDLASNQSRDISFPEESYGVRPTGNPEFKTDIYRFTYSSFITPSSTFDFNVATGERSLRKQQEIPSGFDPSRYEVHRRMAPARDGIQVPVSILMRKGTALDGSSPLLLYGYGSYGLTMEATFNSNVLSLVDRGMTFAIAHVRGGQEMGRQWYDDGKMMKKKNTFNDFIDVAEYLVKNGYTKSDRLAANGGSAGGLLMGAISNMRPDLFKVIVADVPFVDVINTMLDASLPLTAQEWEQWGNPKASAEAFEYMRSYSPYDNVEKKAYPTMLVTTSLNDSQVMYWEPAKWVAKLRAMKTDRNPLYLKVNMAGGHGGSSGRYDRLHEAAFRYAFVLDAVGLGNASPGTSASTSSK